MQRKNKSDEGKQQSPRDILAGVMQANGCAWCYLSRHLKIDIYQRRLTDKFKLNDGRSHKIW